ncbi:hypothetical protein D1007_47385 [Hordeum vulgare]|nr:hypothetical protein D1007_47385 [Hordeum vulgare]
MAEQQAILESIQGVAEVSANRQLIRQRHAEDNVLFDELDAEIAAEEVRVPEALSLRPAGPRALVFAAGAAAEEQAAVDPTGAGELPIGGVKEAAEAAALRAELAQLREKISALAQSTALLASAAV